jgi:hypothetical protein
MPPTVLNSEARRKNKPATLITTVCVKDCGLDNQNIDMIILYSCLVGWLDSLPVEIQIKIKAQSLKTCLVWHENRHGLMHGPCKHTHTIACACVLMLDTIICTPCIIG